MNTNENTNKRETNKFQNCLKYTISIDNYEFNKKHSIEYPSVDKGLPIAFAINLIGVGKSKSIT